MYLQEVFGFFLPPHTRYGRNPLHRGLDVVTWCQGSLVIETSSCFKPMNRSLNLTLERIIVGGKLDRQGARMSFRIILQLQVQVVLTASSTGSARVQVVLTR